MCYTMFLVSEITSLGTNLDELNWFHVVKGIFRFPWFPYYIIIKSIDIFIYYGQ